MTRSDVAGNGSMPEQAVEPATPTSTARDGTVARLLKMVIAIQIAAAKGGSAAENLEFFTSSKGRLNIKRHPKVAVRSLSMRK